MARMRLSPALKQATPIVAIAGNGTRILDEDGVSYLDLTSGIGVTSTGHCHPRVVAAAQRQTAELIHGQYGIVRHRPLLDLLESLGTVMPSHLGSAFFANSGSEAVEAAIRLARNATGRQNVIAFQGSFHGRTLAASALTTSGARFRREGSGGLPPGMLVAPFPNPSHYGWDEQTCNAFALRELDHILVTLTDPSDVAAFIVEPVQGESGFQPANTVFFQGLQERARAHGIALIIDEVQAGVGRTGRFWAHEHFDAEPDIIVFAKGIASGFPLSGIAARDNLMDRALPGSQGGTFSANAVACAAAVATIDVIRDEKLVENAAERGAQLRAGLECVAASHPGRIHDVRGIGLMQATEFRDADGRPDAEAARAVLAAAFQRRVIALPCGPYANIVRMIPALTIDAGEVDDAIEIWSAAVDHVFGAGARNG
ncbi:aminotransferase class III-fold pyridoxal phosphate-dependent enzyme [soil metagenome]